MQPLIRRFPNGETPEHHTWCDAQIRSTKHETRKDSKHEIQNGKRICLLFMILDLSSFFRISIFGFRIFTHRASRDARILHLNDGES